VKIHSKWYKLIIPVSIALIFVIIFTSGQLNTSVQLNKLDTWNYIQMDKILKADQLDLLKQSEENLSAILTVTSPDEALEEFRQLGIVPRSVSGNIITAEIPAARIRDILSNHAILKVKICEQRHNAGIDLPVPEAKAVIGVIDTGIVLQYNDFIDKQGNSRIIAVWDQTEPGMNGPDLLGATPGKLYTGEDIKRYFAQKENSTAPGHGASVVAVAAGKKELLLNETIKAELNRAEVPELLVETTKDEGDLIDAIAFVKKQCEKWQLPGVINLSYGKHNGPHDGTSALSQALGNMTDDRFLIVVSTGNDGQSGIYAHTDTERDSMLDFTVESSNDMTDSNRGIALYGWYTGNHQMDVFLISPSGEQYGLVSAGHWEEWTANFGSITLANGVSGYYGNNREIQIVLQNTEQNTRIPYGTWRIGFATDEKNEVNADFWVVSNPGYHCRFSDTADEAAITFSDIASAPNVIVVGGYLIDSQKKQYRMAEGSGKGIIGDNRVKPDILAPWSVLIKDRDDKLVETGGTSIAAPFVTGLAVNIWGKYPSVSGRDICQYLQGKLFTFTDLTLQNYIYWVNDNGFKYHPFTWQDADKYFRYR